MQCVLLLCVRTPEEPDIVREIPPLLTSCVESPFHFPLGRESLVAKHQLLRRNARGCFRVCVCVMLLMS